MEIVQRTLIGALAIASVAAGGAQKLASTNLASRVEVRESVNAGDTPTCNAGVAADRLTALFHSIGDKNADPAKAFVADQASFVWFCMNASENLGLQGFSTLKLPDLRAYFSARAQHHERLTLDLVDGGSPDGVRVGFYMTATRTADDLPAPSYFVQGKGEMQCETGRFEMLCMGCGLPR